MTDLLRDKSEIIAWLKKHNIKKFKLIHVPHYQFAVNVNGDVSLFAKKLDVVPVKFNIVEGSFWCHRNNLTSLEFCPTEIKRVFNCSENNISSLEYFPDKVLGLCRLDNNPLGDLANVTDFSILHAAHLRIKNSINLANKLETTLEKSASSAKIKI